LILLVVYLCGFGVCAAVRAVFYSEHQALQNTAPVKR
jgi:hypothetical protein